VFTFRHLKLERYPFFSFSVVHIVIVCVGAQGDKLGRPKDTEALTLFRQLTDGMQDRNKVCTLCYVLPCAHLGRMSRYVPKA
jgi:hypothetical protein